MLGGQRRSSTGCRYMKTVKSSYAKAKFNTLSADIARTGEIGDNHLPRPSGGRAYASAFASTEIQ